MDAGNNIAVLVAVIGLIGTVWSAKIAAAAKGDSAEAKDKTEGLSVKKRRQSNTVVLVISLMLLLSAIIFLFFRDSSDSKQAVECAELVLKQARKGLAAQLSGAALYLRDDFHWPSKPPLDVGEIHKSVATQKVIVKDALDRFGDSVSFAGKTFGKPANALCGQAMDQSNEVRDKVLKCLSNPPNESDALIALKLDLLRDLDRLILELDPEYQPPNGAPKPVKPPVTR